jgi:hypothetical protein
MATSNFVAYHQGLLDIANQSVDFVGGTVMAMLLLNSYSPDTAAHRYLSEISADECADVDYARQPVTAKTITLVAGKVRFDCADIDFRGGGGLVTITSKYLVLFLDTGDAGTSKLLWYSDLNDSGVSNSVSTTTDFFIEIDASGIYELTP